MQGLLVFEWQVRYDKGGNEIEFGLFGLDNKPVGKLTMEGYVFEKRVFDTPNLHHVEHDLKKRWL